MNYNSSQAMKYIKKISAVDGENPNREGWPDESRIKTTLGFYTGWAYHSSIIENLEKFYAGTTCFFTDGRSGKNEYKQTHFAVYVKNCPAMLWNDGEVRLYISPGSTVYKISSVEMSTRKEDFSFVEAKPFPSRDEEVIGMALLS